MKVNIIDVRGDDADAVIVNHRLCHHVIHVVQRPCD